MMSRVFNALLGGLACGVFVIAISAAPRAAAQSAPTLNPAITTKVGSLTSDEQAQVAAYVSYWLERLEATDSSTSAMAQVQKSMRSLGDTPFALPNVSPSFRQTYSNLLVPGLERKLSTATSSDRDRVAVRCLYVASRLGTDAALTLIVRDIESRDPLRRNAAAGRAKLAMQDVGAAGTLITPASVTSLLRATVKSAKEESSAPALQRQLELLDEIHLAALKLAAQVPTFADQAHNERINALGARAPRLGVEVIEVDAIVMFLRGLRQHFIANAASHGVHGPVLATHITTILRTAHEQWEETEGDRVLSDAYQRLVTECESFLKFIDQTLRIGSAAPTPNTKLTQHWTDRAKAEFEQDLAQWDQRMQMDPYRSGG